MSVPDRRGLVARGLTFAYAHGASPALDGVDLAVRPAEIVAVAGANGCGKSTLCLLLAGVLRPEGGAITLDGVPLSAPMPGAIQFVQQTVENQVVAPAVAEDVAFGPECLGLARDAVAQRVTAALDAVGLAGFDARDVATLSGGELARLALAGALATRPRYLIADEPTAHLDPASADRFAALLAHVAAGGAGVIFVTHRLEETRVADRLVLLRDGAVAACGRPRELLYDIDTLAACGVEPPRAVRLARERRACGVHVRGAPLTAAELADALCAS